MFTGRLSLTRSQAQSKLIKAGGLPGVSVCSNTNYLVVGDSPGSKLEKASRLDIPIISEEEFWGLLEEYEEEELPVEEWAENDIQIMTEDQLFRLLETLEKKQEDERLAKEKKEKERKQAKYQLLSFELPFLLHQELSLHPEASKYIVVKPVICTNCGSTIPYKVSSTYYCFSCNSYLGSIHRCIYTDHPTLPSYDHGKYKICIHCNTVVFLKNEDLVKMEEMNRSAAYCFSAEFTCKSVELASRAKQNTQGCRSGKREETAEENEELFSQYQASLKRRDERRLARYGKRKEKQEALTARSKAAIESSN